MKINNPISTILFEDITKAITSDNPKNVAFVGKLSNAIIKSVSVTLRSISSVNINTRINKPKGKAY